MYIYIYWAFSTYTFYALVFYGYSSTMRGHILELAGFTTRWEGIRNRKIGEWVEEFCQQLSLSEFFLIFYVIMIVISVQFLKKEKFNNKLICGKLCNNHLKEIFVISLSLFYYVWYVFFYNLWNLGNWWTLLSKILKLGFIYIVI